VDLAARARRYTIALSPGNFNKLKSRGDEQIMLMREYDLSIFSRRDIVPWYNG